MFCNVSCFFVVVMKQNHIANGGFAAENTEEQEGHTDQAVEERAGSVARIRSDPDRSNPGKAIKIGSFMNPSL